MGGNSPFLHSGRGRADLIFREGYQLWGEMDRGGRGGYNGGEAVAPRKERDL